MKARETPEEIAKKRLIRRKNLEIKLTDVKRLERMHEELFIEVGSLIHRLADGDREALSGTTGLSKQIEANREEERLHLQKLFFDVAESFQQQKAQISEELNSKEGESSDY